MQRVYDEVVRRLYARVALGEDIGGAVEPMLSSFRESMFCYKVLSLKPFKYHHLSFFNAGDEAEADMVEAGESNPLPELAQFMPMHSVVNTEQLISPDEFRDTDFYGSVLGKYGDFDRLRGFMIHRQGVEIATASFAIPSDFPADSAEQLNKALEVVRPHFQNAFSVALHLEKRRGVTQAHAFWLDRIPSAAFILDQGQHVAFANKSAEALFADKKSFFVDSRGEVTSHFSGHRKIFEYAIAKCRAFGKPLGPLVLEGDLAPNPFVVVMPINVFAETPAYLAPFVRGVQPLLCILMDPGDQPLAPLEILQNYFGISKREAELLQHLVRGASMAETSDALEISYNTARNHMARIADKASVHSQSELVRLASDLAARVPRQETP
ncbi:hypothetical protein GCM10007094_42970 [Pseudovibrio japonicus]|uniref:HTH luxR-type domain-containing protein n=1 Tax=Pseudovibrio japonicus TaxID=366534 RepID=A0ABQ3ETH3_9HYPH|nr:helix-turn-helix transcriptional regulator [Pseudovibrio japonicus]GHB49166.1 hypothetical protein GCM10007094_42970 [Pseudovibrio japonicus]